MKIELIEYGLENTLGIVTRDLKSAILEKSTKHKNELIYHALGAADALYELVKVTDDSEEIPEYNTLI